MAEKFEFRLQIAQEKILKDIESNYSKEWHFELWRFYILTFEDPKSMKELERCNFEIARSKKYLEKHGLQDIMRLWYSKKLKEIKNPQ